MFPVLKKHHLLGTFFIYTNAIGKKHYFTWDEARELAGAGMTIGGHSKTHPYLWKITDWDTLRTEIIASKKMIEEKLGKPVDYFAYPFGRWNAMAVQVVEEGGYKLARSSYEGTWNGKDSRYILKSIQAPTNLAGLVKVLDKK